MNEQNIIDALNNFAIEIDLLKTEISELRKVNTDLSGKLYSINDKL